MSAQSILEAQTEALLQRLVHEQEQRCRKAVEAAEEQARQIIARAHQDARTRVRQAAADERRRMSETLASSAVVVFQVWPMGQSPKSFRILASVNAPNDTGVPIKELRGFVIRRLSADGTHEPRLFAGVPRRSDRRAQCVERGDGVARAEAVDVRQHRRYASRLGNEPVPPEERVDPDQAPG